MESSVFLIGFSTFLLGFIIGAAVIYFSQKKLDSATAYYSKSIAYREKYTHIHDTMLLDTYQNLSQNNTLSAFIN